MKTLLISSLAFLFSCSLMAQQNLKDMDRSAIKKMCGCYEVTFQFAETFQYSKDSTYEPSALKTDYGLEWVELVEESDDLLKLQHLLIVGPKDEPMIIKHWRQDWLYENTEFYTFNHTKHWKYTEIDPKMARGTWTQKVFQVDDSPRYEGFGTWIHVNGKSYWESTTDAPLPRREFTQRDDYNVTQRTNRHEITDFGWIHDQDNKKIIREDNKKDVILAEEKGLNTYKKVENSRCKPAQDWWLKHKAKWALVRQKWDALFANHQDIHLAPKVDDKPLFEKLFDLSVEATEEEVSDIINSYVKKDTE